MHPPQDPTVAARWADKFGLQVEQAMENHWRDLVDRLRAAIVQLSWSELTFGPGDAFNGRVIQPAVQAWVERFLGPILRQAIDEFRATLQLDPNWQHQGPDLHVQTKGVIEFTDFIRALVVPGGVLVGGGR